LVALPLSKDKKEKKKKRSDARLSRQQKISFSKFHIGLEDKALNLSLAG